MIYCYFLKINFTKVIKGMINLHQFVQHHFIVKFCNLYVILKLNNQKKRENEILMFIQSLHIKHKSFAKSSRRMNTYSLTLLNVNVLLEK